MQFLTGDEEWKRTSKRLRELGWKATPGRGLETSHRWYSPEGLKKKKTAVEGVDYWVGADAVMRHARTAGRVSGSIKQHQLTRQRVLTRSHPTTRKYPNYFSGGDNRSCEYTDYPTTIGSSLI
jgi:hypothetical protein